MFKKIKSFFTKLDFNITNLNLYMNRIHEKQKVTIDFLKSCKSDLEKTANIKNDLAEILMRISSIEMELLMQRKASLDNSFDGKDQLM